MRKSLIFFYLRCNKCRSHNETELMRSLQLLQCEPMDVTEFHLFGSTSESML